MCLCVRSFDFAPFYHIDHSFWNLSNNVVFLFFVLLANRDAIHPVKCLIFFSEDSILPDICEKQEVLRFESNNNVDANCVYKCDDIKINRPDCGIHGDCVVTYTGELKCL